jgi:hypothetical protein
MEFTLLPSPQERTYVYPGHEPMVIGGIVKIRLELDGSHTLVQESGAYHVMAPGWLVVHCSPNTIVV